MRWMKPVAMGVVVLLSAATFVRAAVLDGKRVPEDAKWLLHVDMDALRESKTWKTLLQGELEKNPGFQTTVQNVQVFTGFRFPQDLHDVTLYGKAFNEEAGVVVIHATVDSSVLLGQLALAPGYETFRHGDHDVHSWQDKGKQLYGSFQSTSVAVIGRSRENVQKAIDVLDGKAAGMKMGWGVTEGAKGTVLAYVGGSGLAELRQMQRVKTPLLNEAEMAWVSVGEQEGSLVLRAAVGTKTARAAEQMKALADGMKAMVALAAANENADAKAKAASAAMESLSTKVQEKTVSAELRVQLDTLRKLISLGGAKGGGDAEAPKAAEGGAK
ncbi:MAG: hypothetical protein NTU53_02015 [Planctomycetota bacterium]|nr:hypothetical protein [Planctomycetota bacterium]